MSNDKDGRKEREHKEKKRKKSHISGEYCHLLIGQNGRWSHFGGQPSQFSPTHPMGESLPFALYLLLLLITTTGRESTPTKGDVVLSCLCLLLAFPSFS